MAQVLVIGILALLLLQLAAGQSTTACQNALNALAANNARCAPTVDNPLIFCAGECRGYYDDVINNCDDASAASVQQILDSTCQEGPSETPVTVAPECQNALNTLAANLVGCTPTAENPQLFCTGDCRGYFDAVVNNCDETSAATVQQALDSTCQGSPSETPVTVAPTCQDALTTLAANADRCAPTAENPQLFCTGQCRGYYDAVVDNCDATSAAGVQQTLDATCQGSNGGNGDSNGGVSIFKGLGMFSLLLISVIAAVAF